MFKNINNDDSTSFVATFNYVEGIKNDSEVQIAGIKIGNVKKILISSDLITVHGYIDKKYNIPEDSIIKIKSEVFLEKSIIYRTRIWRIF